MLVHGIYHILGYDHEDDASAEVMESKEIDILATIKNQQPVQLDESKIRQRRQPPSFGNFF